MCNCPTAKKEKVVLFGFEVVDDDNESGMIRCLRFCNEKRIEILSGDVTEVLS
jgi:hypothetical protein